MKINYEKLENAVCKINIVLESSDFEGEFDTALEQLGRNITVPGFRKGKAPLNLIKGKVNPVELDNRIKDNLINKAYRQAILENNIHPAFQPTLKINKDDVPYEVEIEIITIPQVTLGDYKNIKIEKDKVEVTEEDIDKKIQELLNQNAEFEIVEDGILEKGNIAVIDFEGFVDGKPFEGGSAKNYSLEIGSGTFIPGFEDQLIGMKINEEGDVKVTFPANYGAGLSNKEALFKVQLHEIKRKVIPELTDELAKEANIEGVNTVAELKEYYNKSIMESKEKAAESKQTQELIDAICANAELEANEKYIEREANSILDNFKARLQQQGLTYEDYLKMTNTEEATLMQQAKEESLKSTRQYFVLNKIAEVENISVSDEELEAELQKMADTNHITLKKVKEYLKNQLDSFKYQLKFDKVVNFLKQNNQLS